MKLYHVLFILLPLLLLASCETKIEENNLDFGYNYFPLEVGKTWIYQLDSTVFDTTGMGTVVSSSTTFSKETIVEKFTGADGNEVYRIERSERKTDTDPWKVKDVWSAELETQKAIRTEENFRFVKMIFPLLGNEIWDGNQYIDKSTNIILAGETVEIFKNWEYEVISISEPEQIGDFAFEEVTTISQADSENLIELRFSREKYAKGVGLVYKEMRILDTQAISETTPWEDKAQKGFILIQTLIDYK